MISSKVFTCTSQPVAFNGHMSTHERLTGLRNKPQQKQTCQHLAVVYWQLVSLLMELSIDGENCSLTWYAEVAGFIKAGPNWGYCGHYLAYFMHTCKLQSLPCKIKVLRSLFLNSIHEGFTINLIGNILLINNFYGHLCSIRIENILNDTVSW